MNAHVSSILLGVRDMDRSKEFYKGLGWKVEKDYGISVFFESDGGSLVGFYGHDGLAEMVGASPEGSGFKGFALSYVVRSEARVDEIIADAEKAGATILKPAATLQWGGYGGDLRGPGRLHLESRLQRPGQGPALRGVAAARDHKTDRKERAVSDKQTSTKGTTTVDKTEKVFTKEERDAIQERAREVKAGGRRGKRGADEDGESEVLAKIAEMTGSDRAMAERIHAIVKSNAPALASKTWYGQPAYAKDGKVVCFFQPAAKFKSRYATFGFQEDAHLDEGSMWATSWALTELTAADEARIAALVKKAAS